MSETIKKHERGSIGEWISKSEKPFFIHLYVAGSYETAERCCREACFPSGLCVTIEPVRYIFGGGSEDGVRVGFIQYPPFPENEQDIYAKAENLGKRICEEGFQFSFTLVTPNENTFFSRRK